MGSVDVDMVLASDQISDPIIWTGDCPLSPEKLAGIFDTSTEAMERYVGPGRGMALKSFGHTPTGVHFLLTRAGTTVHTDPAYTRYSHQLILRNDGNRIRGLPRFDSDNPANWHRPFLPGVMYALDTHSPHQGLHDPRIADKPGLKAVIAVDRDEILDIEEVWELFRPWVFGRVQFADVAQPEGVLSKTTAPRWKPARA
jgi:hypothetical protein